MISGPMPSPCATVMGVAFGIEVRDYDNAFGWRGASAAVCAGVICLLKPQLLRLTRERVDDDNRTELTAFLEILAKQPTAARLFG